MTKEKTPDIFREYDIRGTFGKTLFLETAYTLGKAFGSYCWHHHNSSNAPKVCLVYDGRLSSPKLYKALIHGLLNEKIDVIQGERGPTPYLYWLDHYHKASGAIMITGSHNPIDDNGFKITYRQKPFFADTLKNFYHQFWPKDTELPAIDFSLSPASSFIKRYSDALLKYFSCKLSSLSSKHIIWDPGYGAANDVLALILPKLPGKHTILHETVDGNFPDISPDPTHPSRKLLLQKFVTEKNADLGLSFDGDADRLVVIDKNGYMWEGDEVFTYFACAKITQDQHCPCFVDIKFSQILQDFLTEKGAQVKQIKTGHANIKSSLFNAPGSIAGEVSGHFFFFDEWNGCDDAIYAAFRLLSIISNQEISPEIWLSLLPVRFTSKELRICCSTTTKEALIPYVKTFFSKEMYTDIDGLRVTLPDGWFLIRTSKTEDKIVIRFESNSENGYKILSKQLTSYLSIFDLSVG